MPQEDPTHINKVFEQSEGRIRIDGTIQEHLIAINGHDTHVAIDQIIAVMNNFGIHRLRIIPMKKEDKSNPKIGGVLSDGAATLTRIVSVSKSKAHKSNITDNNSDSPFLEDWSVDLDIEVDVNALQDSSNLADVLMMRGIDNSIQLNQTLEHLNGIFKRALLEGGFKHNFQFPYQLGTEDKADFLLYMLGNAVLYLPFLYSVSLLMTQKASNMIGFVLPLTFAYLWIQIAHWQRSKSMKVSRHDILPGVYPFMNVLLGFIRTLNLEGFTAVPRIDEQEP